MDFTGYIEECLSVRFKLTIRTGYTQSNLHVRGNLSKIYWREFLLKLSCIIPQISIFSASFSQIDALSFIKSKYNCLPSSDGLSTACY